MKYRNEIKYIINKTDAEILKQRLNLFMSSDSNSYNEDKTYLIRSLYFDNENSDAYYEKLDGVEYRKKYRIRIYNNSDEFIRLECKYKHNNMTGKEHVLINGDICNKIINGNIEDIEIEKDDLLKKFIIDCHLNQLKPSVIVDYKRLAYTYHVSDVRVTFDYDIKSGLYNYDLFSDTTYSVTNDIVLEVKFNEILPEPIKIILETVPTMRTAFSKFATCRSIK